MVPPPIEIRKLFFYYPNNRRIIFSDFDWTVEKGDFWVIVGANGSGKTSLIRLLLGLECANGGSIRVLGYNLKGSPGGSLSPSERAARAQIGHVPQHLQFDRRLPIPVLDVVEGGALVYSFWRGLGKGQKSPSAKERTEICLSALAQVGMESYAKDRFSMLSGGQKQRVLIARALATQSPILILDEPTASVDPTAAQEIVQICRQIRRKHTILFISHDISMIPEVCEHILCLSPATAEALVQFPHRGTVAHSHDVRGLSREEILLLLYSHWGLPPSRSE
ncbi:ATP-binding cassette domain-containing protein [Candidatus Haliotispira prima]|uniref:ATP-binding cassette domain-containing protein n=1 Tax=Candidatus Haliotispira prima TaxID=3034016 RepID=A0ABY8MDU7_9SPIO|nr:ATP-binding cassette domain-containing protein [Candidatus Haliotispira prima]